jgi:FMN phosphatase YigB (HAD superfamily)
MKGCILIDLDNTIYDQTQFDDQVIDLSLNVLEQKAIEAKTCFGKLRLVLKRARKENRSDRYLYNNILTSFGFSSRSVNIFLEAYKSHSLNTELSLKPSHSAFDFISTSYTNRDLVLVSNGSISQQLRKCKLMEIDQYFCKIIILDGQNGRLYKPDASYTRHILSKNSIRLDNTSAMIGDLRSDELFAMNLGIGYYHTRLDIGWDL